MHVRWQDDSGAGPILVVYILRWERLDSRTATRRARRSGADARLRLYGFKK
jgi:hypothetical protein